MKVSSPIGNLPFALESARIERGAVVFRGRMGGWPARITIERGDLVPLLTVLWPPLLALGALLVLIVLAAALV
jgi:hypothetical protein